MSNLCLIQMEIEKLLEKETHDNKLSNEKLVFVRIVTYFTITNIQGILHHVGVARP